MVEAGGYVPPQEAVKPPVVPQGVRAPEAAVSATDFASSQTAVENPNAAKRAPEQQNQILTPAAEASLAELQSLGLNYEDNKTVDELVNAAVALGRPNDAATRQTIEQSQRLYLAQKAAGELENMGISMEGQTADAITKTLHEQHGWQDDEPTRQYVEGALVLQKEKARRASAEQNATTEQSAPSTGERVADTTSRRQEEGPVSPESEVARQRKQINARYEQGVRFVDRRTTNEEKDKDQYLVQALTIDMQARDVNNPDLGYGRYQVGTNPDGTPRVVDIHESIGPIMTRLEAIAAEVNELGKPTARALEAQEFVKDLKPHMVENPDGPGHSFEVTDPTKPARNEQTKKEDLNLMKADRYLENIAKKLQRDKKNRDLVEQLLLARQAGGDLANRDIHAAVKYHAIVTGYKQLSSGEQKELGLSDELVSTLHAQIRPGAERLKAICKDAGGLTDDELQTLGSMITGGTMADFLEPMADFLEAPDEKTRNEVMDKMSEIQKKIANNKRLRNELNTAVYGSAEGVSAKLLDKETDTYLEAGKKATRRERRKAIGKWTAIGLAIGAFATMSRLQKEEQGVADGHQ